MFHQANKDAAKLETIAPILYGYYNYLQSFKGYPRSELQAYRKVLQRANMRN